jgi:hypothetical protein
VQEGIGTPTTATWVAIPLMVVGTVDVYPTAPPVTVTVLRAGTPTTATWVAIPLMVVGTVEVYPTLPEVTVTVLRTGVVGLPAGALVIVTI